MSKFFPDGFLFPKDDGVPLAAPVAKKQMVDSSDSREITTILYENYDLPDTFFDFKITQIDQNPEKYRVNVRAKAKCGIVVLHSFVATKTSPGEYLFQPQLDKPRTVKVLK